MSKEKEEYSRGVTVHEMHQITVNAIFFCKHI